MLYDVETYFGKLKTMRRASKIIGITVGQCLAVRRRPAMPLKQELELLRFQSELANAKREADRIGLEVAATLIRMALLNVKTK